jgi:hypothetical protein
LDRVVTIRFGATGALTGQKFFRTMPSDYYWSFLIGIFAGTMTGLMGASGMMAVVPGIILLGYSAYQAIGVSLAVDVILSRMNGTGYSPSLYRLVSS